MAASVSEEDGSQSIMPAKVTDQSPNLHQFRALEGPDLGLSLVDSSRDPNSFGPVAAAAAASRNGTLRWRRQECGSGQQRNGDLRRVIMSIRTTTSG